MGIEIGEVYWYTLPEEDGEKSIPHPYVALEDAIKDSAGIVKVSVCGITTNMKKVSWPGNVVLNINEANLTKVSIVDVSQVRIVPVKELGEYIGTLSHEKVEMIRSGIALIRALQENNRKNSS